MQVILADPPWRYQFSKSKSRKIENQYPTMSIEDIATFTFHVDDNAVLFMWATAPKLMEALYVMNNWGFEYKTQAVWDKKIQGMGYWFRGQHEILLVGTRGHVSPPKIAHRRSSVFSERRRAHSKKPACVYEWIERAFPNVPKLELFARHLRRGWDQIGNELPIESAVSLEQQKMQLL